MGEGVERSSYAVDYAGGTGETSCTGNITGCDGCVHETSGITMLHIFISHRDADENEQFRVWHSIDDAFWSFGKPTKFFELLLFVIFTNFVCYRNIVVRIFYVDS